MLQASLGYRAGAGLEQNRTKQNINTQPWEAGSRLGWAHHEGMRLGPSSILPNNQGWGAPAEIPLWSPYFLRLGLTSVLVRECEWLLMTAPLPTPVPVHREMLRALLC